MVNVSLQNVLIFCAIVVRNCSHSRLGIYSCHYKERYLPLERKIYLERKMYLLLERKIFLPL